MLSHSVQNNERCFRLRAVTRWIPELSLVWVEVKEIRNQTQNENNMTLQLYRVRINKSWGICPGRLNTRSIIDRRITWHIIIVHLFIPRLQNFKPKKCQNHPNPTDFPEWLIRSCGHAIYVKLRLNTSLHVDTVWADSNHNHTSSRLQRIISDE